MPQYTIPQVMDRIKGLSSLAAFKPDEFAEEGGYAESFVYELKEQAKKGKSKKLKPTQLRKFFHEIKDIRRQIKRGATYERTRVALVMPTLAYAVGRELIPDEFYQLMKQCFGKDKCRTQADFERAADFLEAVMAYHKYYESMK